MASKQVVYVHGAGPQKEPVAFKRDLDVHLFGRDMQGGTRLAYYADVRWPPRPPAGRGAAPDTSGRGRRAAAIRTASTSPVSPKAAAASIVAATLVPVRRGPGRTAAPVPPADDLNEAEKLVEQLYRRADRVASRSSFTRPGRALGPTFPDPIFRFIVGKFASDVIDYLYGPQKEAMRAPVRRVLLQNPPPKVIVAHSLGTIILYDVLSEAALAGLKVDVLVTIGCPLGIGNVQRRLRDQAGRPNPVPKPLAAWTNFADRFDPVALEATLRDEFDPPKNFATDHEVNNAARDNHELFGYLSIGLVRSAIVAAAG